MLFLRPVASSNFTAAGRSFSRVLKQRERLVRMSLVASFAIIAPLLATVLTLEAIDSNAIRSSMTESDIQASAVLKHFEDISDGIDSILLNVINNFDYNYTPKDVHNWLDHLQLPPGVAQISWVNAGGVFVASNLSLPDKPVDLSDREHILVHLNGQFGDNLFIGRPVLGKISNEWTIQFTRAARDPSGDLIGIFVASYKINDFIAFYDRLVPELSGVIALLSFDGFVSARSHMNGKITERILSTPISDIDLILRQRRGYITRASPFDGVERLVAFVVSDRYPIAAVAGNSLEAIRESVSSTRLAVIIIGSGLAVTLMVLGSTTLRNMDFRQSVREERLRMAAQRQLGELIEAVGQAPDTCFLKVKEGNVHLLCGTMDREKIAAVGAKVSSQGYVERILGSRRSAVRTEHLNCADDMLEVDLIAAHLPEDSPDVAAESGRRPTELVVFAVDRTRQRIAENELYQMSKMAALGEAVTGMAHEVNTPVAAIRMAAMNGLAIIEDDPSTGAVATKLRRIVEQTERIKKIIDQMRMFGRKGSIKPQFYGVTEILDSALEIFRTAHASAKIKIQMVSAVPSSQLIKCRREQVEQVIFNILLNARDAILVNKEKIGEILITVDISARCNIRVLRVRVRDNGGGIPSTIIDRIFQPFFTTKDVGRGTGLGLSVSYGIVREHGGSLTVANVAGGAEFTILLPLDRD